MSEAFENKKATITNEVDCLSAMLTNYLDNATPTKQGCPEEFLSI